MIPEFPNLPTKLQPEDRFIFALKNKLREHAQEINKIRKALGIAIDIEALKVTLQGYYTKEETDELINGLNETIEEIVDQVLIDYATKKYVDDAIAEIDVGDALPEWLKRFKVVDGKLCQKRES